MGIASHAHEAHTLQQSDQLAISLAADQAGRLWRASVKEGVVWVDSSVDLGKTFTAAVSVNIKPMKIAAEGEARPKIAVSKEGNIYVTWTESLKKPYAG
ncbi:MAG TPA: hypothetical protein DCO68_00695, partial [Methylophilaceae bacterium]|nr:hypothetical protein [Methylophilaceae bacterium]